MIMTTAIICIFIAGYIMVAMENVTRINRTAVALMMAVLCWTLFYIGFGASPENISTFTRTLGETSGILFFLLGAMVIVEVVDTNGGFTFVREKLASHTKVGLLWKLTLITFFLSAVLDNMTTAIVMTMVTDKLVNDRRDKLFYVSMIIVAANSGGAFSPIGDVTTIMLWVKGNISTFGVMKALFLPALVSVIVPAVILSFFLKGKLGRKELNGNTHSLTDVEISSGEKVAVFCVGVGGLLLVPVFRFVTDLPPFMGILLILAVLWVVTEFIFKQKKYQDIPQGHLPDVSALLHKIDLSTILFFLGILTTVAAVSETGALKALGTTLDKTFNSNPYIITGIIGILSAIIDNVPLVASCMGMYDVAMVQDTMTAAGNVAVYGIDGTFWQLLAYSAGTGGSMLIIGSAAGVVVMGLQNISFGWYLKHFSWIALLGFLAGMATFAILS